MIEFTEDDDIVKVLLENMENSVLSLLYFTASWCGPCQKIKPFLKDFSDKSNNAKYNIEFYMLDIDKNEEFCNKCKIKSVPTFFIMNGKELLSSQSGSDQDKLSEMIVETFNKFNSNKHIKNKS
jgi:thioredoxin 1